MSKILVIVEGKSKEPLLFKKLFHVYDPSANIRIISYETNIYELYRQLFKDNEEDSRSLLMLLRSREKDEDKKKIFDEHYNEVILIFDFDPQDNLYSAEKLNKLMQYFNNSTENGRLYINYPMVESLFHLSKWDESQEIFNQRYICKNNLLRYKSIVGEESCNKYFRKFTREQYDILIKFNLFKVLFLLNTPLSEKSLCDYKKLYKVFEIETQALEKDEIVYVLNTCILYFYEYKSSMFNFFNNNIDFDYPITLIETPHY